MDHVNVDDIATQRLKADIDIKIAEQLPVQSLHLLPCEIGFVGPAPVSSYFIVTDDKSAPALDQASSEDATSEPTYYKAMLRGHELNGTKVSVDNKKGKGSGYVFKESSSAGAARTFEATHTFKHFTLWNRDNLKEERNFLTHTIHDWPDIAKAMHDPI